MYELPLSQHILSAPLSLLIRIDKTDHVPIFISYSCLAPIVRSINTICVGRPHICYREQKRVFLLRHKLLQGTVC